MYEKKKKSYEIKNSKLNETRHHHEITIYYKCSNFSNYFSYRFVYVLFFMFLVTRVLNEKIDLSIKKSLFSSTNKILNKLFKTPCLILLTKCKYLKNT